MHREHGQSLLMLATSASFFVLFLVTLHPTDRSPLRFFDDPVVNRRGFHFLVPTTNANSEVCKLLGSSAILGYPTPSLLGWEGRGRWNGSESHLFKLSETLYYLNTLRKEQDNDLVLVLDAYDVWLQLPPSVLVRRYQKALAKENDILRRIGILDKQSPDGASIRNTILFGADKFCWPQNGNVIPCWAAPESPLPPTFFGPGTDREEVKMRPRFLNSGSIMGPVKDLRNLFKATVDQVALEWDDDFIHKTSDQHYLSILWGDQEEARLAVRNGSDHVLQNQIYTEFHIAVDHESDAFQVNNWYSQYVTWMMFNQSSHGGHSSSSSSLINPGRLDRFNLTQDVLLSQLPFATSDGNEHLPANRTWTEVMLGTNTLTASVFPLYHITGDKLMRNRWWPRMWFHPYGEALLELARERWLATVRSEGHHVVAEINGVKYISAQPTHGDVYQAMRARDKTNLKGGVWNDLGEYMSWNEICGQHEERVFVGRAPRL